MGSRGAISGPSRAEGAHRRPHGIPGFQSSTSRRSPSGIPTPDSAPRSPRERTCMGKGRSRLYVPLMVGQVGGGLGWALCSHWSVLGGISPPLGFLLARGAELHSQRNAFVSSSFALPPFHHSGMILLPFPSQNLEWGGDDTFFPLPMKILLFPCQEMSF